MDRSRGFSMSTRGATKQALDYKVKLLKYLITHQEVGLRPDIKTFWEYRAYGFKEEPKQTGEELEEFCEKEAQAWSEEHNNPRKKRRSGHEANSEYDQLMKRWVGAWEIMLLKHLNWVAYNEGSDCGEPETMLSEMEKVKQKVEAMEKLDKDKSAVSRKRSSQRKSEVEKDGYDNDKLKRVVEAAKREAAEVGRPGLADTMNEIYLLALVDTKLRILLEAILTHTATPEQNDQFQEYVRAAKKKVKNQKAPGLKKSSAQMQLDRAAARLRTEDSFDCEGDGGAGRGHDGQGSERAVSDSACASEPKEEKKMAITRGKSNNKRRRNADSSLLATEQHDLSEAERVAKRRKHTESNVDDSYNPSDKKTESRRKDGKQLIEHALWDSSPVLDFLDMDVEPAYDTLFDQLVRKIPVADSRQGTDEPSDPVSPAVNNNASVKSVVSPTVPPTAASSDEHDGEQQATTGAEQSSATSNAAATVLPAPPTEPEKEQITGEESSHAYRIITGAAAEAINPALSRLEGKIDSLLNVPILQGVSALGLPVPGASQDGSATSTSAVPDFANIVNTLKSGSLDVNSPEMSQIILQLAQKASEASIHAAEAARHASTVARDASQILVQIASQKVSAAKGRPATRGRGRGRGKK